MKMGMKHLSLYAALAFTVLSANLSFAQKTEIVVYKTPTCGCCSKWEDHLRAADFKVVSKSMDDLSALKAQKGLPQKLQSCHTAVVQNYVIEGHVPASSIKKLLAQNPRKVKGIAVPGMPMGSPGMEGFRSDPYEVLSFEKDGTTKVFDKF